MKRRNAEIDFYKFLFSWVIVMFHLTGRTKIGCIGGFFAVDYFLVVSGYFLFRSFDGDAAQGRPLSPGAFFCKRFARFFPWAATAQLFAFFALRVHSGEITGFLPFLDAVTEDIWELLLVKSAGLSADGFLLNGPAWTVSTLLLCGFVLWGCLYYLKEPFRQLLLPLSLMIGFAVWRHIEEARYYSWLGFTTFGMLRTWLDLCLGYFSVLLADRLSSRRPGRAGKIALTIFACLSMGLVFFLFFNSSTRFSQWFCILLFVIDIAVSASGCSYLNDLLSRLPFVSFLGEFSFSLYLVHLPFITLFTEYVRCAHWTRLSLRFAVLLSAAACVHLFATRLLIKLFRRASAPASR